MNDALLKRLKELCEEKGISQRQLQRDLNLSTSTVSKWKTSTPKHDTLQAVADYFNVSTDYLTGRTKYRNKEHMLQAFDLKYKPDMNDTEIPVDYCVQTDEGIILIETKSTAPKYIDCETRRIAEYIQTNEKMKEMLSHIMDMTSEQFDTIYNMVMMIK